jgi:protein-S-isoprenylcysteine O-methyltransferase Ste14
MTIPRWAASIVAILAWVVAIPLAHGLMPWAMSLLAPRLGWTEDQPGVGNLLGLVLIGGGVAGLLWILAVGLGGVADLPDRIALNWAPKILMMRGPYAYSRNPMYLAELGLWLGWALFFGSIPVLLGFIGFCVAVSLVVRREERDLERHFGEAYRQYRNRVPRWLEIDNLRT